MADKIWYHVYGRATGSTAVSDELILLAKVKSKGNAFLVAELFKKTYVDVVIK